MEFKNHALSHIIKSLNEQNVCLARARHAYLIKEAEKPHIEAGLVKEHSNKGSSHAQATTDAKASKEWLVFHQELAKLESIYEFHRLKFSIMEKEYQAQYINLKLDESLIKKQE